MITDKEINDHLNSQDEYDIKVEEWKERTRSALFYCLMTGGDIREAIDLACMDAEENHIHEDDDKTINALVVGASKLMLYKLEHGE